MFRRDPSPVGRQYLARSPCAPETTFWLSATRRDGVNAL
jgi:hypothetical protein